MSPAQRERPRSFADRWDAPGTPRPPTTIANPLDALRLDDRGSGAEEVAAARGVDRRGGIDLSPDGAEVAFAWDRSGSLEIYTAPILGDRIIQLTDAGARSVAPRWSPDGRWVAFVRESGDARRLHVVDRDGEHEREIGPDDPLRGELTLSPEGIPQWSPNTAPALLAAAGLAHASGSARWSPDRSMVAFVTAVDGLDRIAFASVRDGKVAKVDVVTGAPFAASDPWWRPDGRGVVYLRHEPGHVSARRLFTVSHADDAALDLPGWVFSPRLGRDSETVVAILVDGPAADLVVRPKGAVDVLRVTRASAAA